MKSTHRIRILGREIQVKSSSSAETVREVESFLNERAAEITGSLPDADQQLVALLILLNITESYLALKRDSSKDTAGYELALEKLAAKIDRALGEGSPRRVNI